MHACFGTTYRKQYCATPSLDLDMSGFISEAPSSFSRICFGDNPKAFEKFGCVVNSFCTIRKSLSLLGSRDIDRALFWCGAVGPVTFFVNLPGTVVVGCVKRASGCVLFCSLLLCFESSRSLSAERRKDRWGKVYKISSDRQQSFDALAGLGLQIMTVITKKITP